MDIPEEKQYEYLTHHLEYLNEKIIESFELFIKLATAIIGGVFFLHWRLAENNLSGASFVQMSNILFWVVGISVIILIFNNLHAWRSYRTTLSKEYPDIPISKPIWWWLSEVMMGLVILLTCILFSRFNPLSN
jgi:magnesium-transporting ATPase (P-type)